MKNKWRDWAFKLAEKSAVGSHINSEKTQDPQPGKLSMNTEEMAVAPKGDFPKVAAGRPLIQRAMVQRCVASIGPRGLKKTRSAPEESHGQWGGDNAESIRGYNSICRLDAVSSKKRAVISLLERCLRKAGCTESGREWTRDIATVCRNCNSALFDKGRQEKQTGDIATIYRNHYSTLFDQDCRNRPIDP
ncbi:hypothetical protein B0H10DRAFT_1971359 [Mycena sp. CBHHK59/15]|nr:hypothetical protein B0H10DRAFT_1971359 [Mycena sp. CBHHK59/15]